MQKRLSGIEPSDTNPERRTTMAAEFIVALTDAQYEYAEKIATKNAEREAKGHKLRGTLTGTTVAKVVAQMFTYGLNRLETLDRDARKEAAIKANGVEAGVERRRYEPRHKDPVYADKSQPKTVIEWAATAPLAS